MLYVVAAVLQWLSRVQLFATTWTVARQAPLSFTILSLLKFTSSESVMPSEGRQNEIHNHRKLIKLITWTTAFLTHPWTMSVGPPKTDSSWWRVLTKHGPLKKGMANHFSILALRTTWTVWKGKKNEIVKPQKTNHLITWATALSNSSHEPLV